MIENPNLDRVVSSYGLDAHGRAAMLEGVLHVVFNDARQVNRIDPGHQIGRAGHGHARRTHPELLEASVDGFPQRDRLGSGAARATLHARQGDEVVDEPGQVVGLTVDGDGKLLLGRLAERLPTLREEI
jgi:hypothetical protein